MGVVLLLLLCFAAIMGRLVQVQVVSPGSYVAFGASQRFQDVKLPADRGSIFDRNGNDLAVSIPQSTIWADPRLIQDPAGTATKLAGLLSLDTAAASALSVKLNAKNAFTYVERRVPDDVAAAVKKAALPGVFLLQEPKRFTPAGDLAKSVLGQVGVDNEGLSGLELQYDTSLTGKAGDLKVERDPNGRTIPAGQKQVVAAQRGNDLVLTLDRSMQYETERALAAQILAKHAKGGTAIVSRPGTGEILAMASMSTDPKTGQVLPIADDTAVTASYEPGSVNKVVTVAAAIEEGLVSPSTQLVVPDHLQVGDQLFTDHVPHPTAAYSVTKVLSDSSNVGTIKIAQQLGADRFDSYLRRFGFGQKTSLGLPYEAGGILLPRNQYNATSMGAIPIGQGIAVTAMQMLQAYNVIANDGMYVPPKLVLDTVDHAGDAPARSTAAPRTGSCRRPPPSRSAACWRPWSPKAPARVVGSRATRWPARPARPASPTPSGAATRTPTATTTTWQPLRGSCPPSVRSCPSSWSSTSPRATSTAVRSPPRCSPTWRSTACGRSTSRRPCDAGSGPRHGRPPPPPQPPRPPCPAKLRAKTATTGGALVGTAVDTSPGSTTPSTVAASTSPSGGSPPGSTGR